MDSELPVNRLIRAGFESPDEVSEIVRQAPELLEARTGLGETALHYLAVENQIRAVVLLVEAGAQVNTLNGVGTTPLADAASLGYAEMVECLLSRGAQLKISGQSDPTLHQAVRGGSLAVVKLLLAAGAPLDEQDEIQDAPLHVAAEDESRLPILKLLLESGANPRLTRIFDETPLDVALEGGCDECARTLIAAGAPRGKNAA
jgi:ankyrin repeat protein